MTSTDKAILKSCLKDLFLTSAKLLSLFISLALLIFTIHSILALREPSW